MNNLTYLVAQSRQSPDQLHQLFGYLIAQYSEFANSEHTPLTVAQPSLETKQQNWSHRHDNIEIFFQLQGRNQFQTPQETFTQVSNSVVIMPPRTPHIETPQYERKQWSHLLLALKPDAFLFHLTVESPDPTTSKRIIAAGQIVVDNALLLKGLIHEMIRHPQPKVQRLLFCTFCNLLHIHLNQSNNQSIAEQTLPIIARNIANPDLSVGYVAQQLGCHPDSLSRSFKKKFQLSFREYLCQQRMLLATSLLQQQYLEIAEVARLCGYRDHAYFSAEFRQHTGTTPTTYRNRAFKIEA